MTNSKPVSLEVSRTVWLMKKRGWTDEQLATRYGMTIARVAENLTHYERYCDDSVDATIAALSM